MMGILKEHKDRVKDERWAVARSFQWNDKDGQADAGEDWVEKKARKWAQQIFKNLGPDALASIKGDVLARALEIVNPELPGILINEWREQALETLGIEADQLPKDAESQLERTTEEEEAGIASEMQPMGRICRLANMQLACFPAPVAQALFI
jgi:hypothetical protein